LVGAHTEADLVSLCLCLGRGMVGAQESAVVVNGSIYVTHPVVMADWDYLSGGQSSESGFFGESGRAVREGGGRDAPEGGRTSSGHGEGRHHGDVPQDDSEQLCE
jgi:hypothetical protein